MSEGARNDTLKELLVEWTDFDYAAFQVGVVFGLWPPEGEDQASFRLKNKHVFWTNNPLGNALHQILNSLVKCGILERRDEPDLQYRWKGA